MKNKFQINGPSFLSDNSERNRFIYCLFVTFMLGLIAHAYAYFSGDFSHDSLSAIYAGVNEENWKIALGRFFVPIYRSVIRGGIAFPWLIGMLSLFWIGLSVYLIVRVFGLESKLAISVLAGILVTNLTVTAMTATFLYELDIDMFALLCATVAVYLWKHYSWGILPGMLFVTMTLGIYQSYFSVTITLIIIASMCALLQKEPAQMVLLKGIQGIGMLVGGGIAYVISLNVLPRLTGIVLVDSYNGLSSLTELSLSSMSDLIASAYKDWLQIFLSPKATYMGEIVGIANWCLFVVTGILVLFVIITKTIKSMAKVIFVALFALLPLGMNLSFILSGGMVHDLMRYAFWLFYFLVLLLVYWMYRSYDKIPILPLAIKTAAYIFIFLILWNNIQVSNASYLKKDLEQQSTIAQMCRVIDRLEDIPEYVAGESPVVFVAQSQQAVTMSCFEEISEFTGMESSTAITYNSFGMYKYYFDYLLNTPINLDAENWSRFQTEQRVDEMPAFPNMESIRILDGIFVVKMG